MIKEYNNKSLIFGFPGLVMQCAGSLHPLLFWAGTILLIFGLMYYAKAKGHPAIWGLFGIFNLLGVIVLAALKDKEISRDNADTCRDNVEGKRAPEFLFIYC